MMSEAPRLDHVLAATDLSTPARRAALRAARVARATGAALTLQHTISRPALDELRHWVGLHAPAEAALREAARRELRALADTLERRLHAAVDARVDCGDVAHAIAAAADALDAGLVVIGARGAGTLRRLLLGSTASRLLRASRRPLLVVRRYPRTGYRKLLVPVDFSPFGAAAIKLARCIAPDAELMLMHAWRLPFEDKLGFAGVDDATLQYYRSAGAREAREGLHRLAQEQGLRSGQWTPWLVHGDAGYRIVEAAAEHTVDLIAIGKHGRNRTEELLLGSVTEHVLAEAKVDLLLATVPSGA